MRYSRPVQAIDLESPPKQGHRGNSVILAQSVHILVHISQGGGRGPTTVVGDTSQSTSRSIVVNLVFLPQTPDVVVADSVQVIALSAVHEEGNPFQSQIGLESPEC